MLLHGEGGGSSSAAPTSDEAGEAGAKVERPEGYEPPIQDSV